MAYFKRALRKTVGGYHSVNVGDEDFDAKEQKFRIYTKNLLVLSERAEKLSSQMMTLAAATSNAARFQQGLVAMNPEHLMVKEIGAINKALEAYAKKDIQALIQTFQKNVKTPLQQRKNEARRIEEKLRQRQNFRKDFMYYQGKVGKLEETHQNNLKNGKVEKVAFTEMLERNHKKVEKSKDDFEKSSKALGKQLTVLLSTYQQAIRSIAIEALEIQNTLYTDFCGFFMKLSSFYHKVENETVNEKVSDLTVESKMRSDMHLGSYLVVHEDGAPVQENVTEGSNEFDCLELGVQVNVVEVIGIRARIDKPVAGWISLETPSGEDVVVPKLPPKTPENRHGRGTFFQK